MTPLTPNSVPEKLKTSMQTNMGRAIAEESESSSSVSENESKVETNLEVEDMFKKVRYL